MATKMGTFRDHCSGTDFMQPSNSVKVLTMLLKYYVMVKNSISNKFQ